MSEPEKEAKDQSDQDEKKGRGTGDIDSSLDTPKHEETTELNKPNVFASPNQYDNPAFTLDIPMDRNGKSYTVQHEKVPETKETPKNREEVPNKLELFILKIQNNTSAIWAKNRKLIKTAILCLLLVLFYIYVGCAIYYDFHRSKSWCHGAKLLLLLTIFVHIGVFYKYVVKKYVPMIFQRMPVGPLRILIGKLQTIPYLKLVLYAIPITVIIVFVIVDSINDTERLISASGVLIMVFICFVFSKNPAKVKWRPVIWGLLLQFVFALVILRWNFGKQMFSCVGEKISTFLDFTDAGSSFVFGYLVTGVFKNSDEVKVPEQYAPFAFKVLPVIIFFNAVTAVLYYLGVMQVIVKKVGWLLQVTIGTTAAESMNAAGNIFLGMTEAPLIIAPFLSKMTASELHSVMTGGFATIAGGIMAAYISFGIKASHLLSASVMSAPAALGISKLLFPETEESLTNADNIEMVKCEDRNVLEAAVRGSSQSILCVANIVVNLIAFLAFIAFVDAMLSWFGGLVNCPELSFELILSKIFVPIALIMGVEWNDCEQVARLIGLKTMVNEFVAYARLGELIEEGKLSVRSETIATYALCGFSNIGSIGVQMGALSSFAPCKKAVFASVAVRAMIAGSIACFLTACIAGTLIPSAELQRLQVLANGTLASNTTEMAF